MIKRMTVMSEEKNDPAPSQPRTMQESKQHVLHQFEQILKRASEKKASDLHLKAGLPPIVRVNGQLYYLGEEAGESVSRLSNSQLNQFSRALMNARQMEKYEGGEEVDLGYEITGIGRFRINICQQRSNPRLVCRHIPDSIKTIQELMLPPVCEQLAAAYRGLILVTGATGSGKSTTLAAMIDHIARTRSCHIVTIEDPIEFILKDRKSIVTQREVGLDTKNFTQALKYALRQDPDVILVGEMRDEETIHMALSAAETGHLVLSTLHTVDAKETINRIMGVVSAGNQSQVRAQLAAVLVGVVSQRLLKRKDGKGRIAAVEVLVSNVRVKDMISDPARTTDLRRVIEESRSLGMQSFDQSLMQLFQQQLITKEEALMNCSNPQDFQLRLDGVVGGEWREGPVEPSTDRQEQVKQLLENKSDSIEIEFGNLANSKR
jgi:twitching motility protein PilT